jgi:hypothetical protein
MRLSIITSALFVLVAAAAPVANDASFQGEAKSISALIPQVQQLLQNHPDIEAKLAAAYPKFSKGNGHLDYAVLKSVAEDPSSDLVSMLVSFLVALPGYITGGVGSILGAEWSLLSSIGSGLLSFVPGFGK